MIRPFLPVWHFHLLILLCVLLSCNSRETKPVHDGLKSLNEQKLAGANTSLNALHLCTEIPPSDSKRKGSQAGGVINTFWPDNHRTLSVKFMDGDSIMVHKVMMVAKEWEQYCGIRFNFEPSQKADITITFRQVGSWSCIGKQSKYKVPSMNLGWLTSTSLDSEYHRVVLHEFGHALGLVHEHQNPSNNPIRWNEVAVYSYYSQGPHNWSKEKVEQNIFMRYGEKEMRNTEFDALSIMLYAVPKELTMDGYSTHWNAELSEHDKKFIGIIYPQ